jgi:hypothetical protein
VSDSIATTRRTGAGMVVYAITLFVLVASGAAPSPLYPRYEAEWGLAPLMITVVFAAYVVGMLVTLLTAGGLSDFVGRKPMIFVALAISLSAMALFATATSGVALLIARIVQGFAIGLSFGPLGAGMIDHQPGKQPVAALLNGIAPPFGLAVGGLGSGLLVQFAVAPHLLVYIVLAALMLACGISIVFVPETVRRRPGALASLTPTVAVPAPSRAVFAGAVGCMLASWAMMGLYLSLGGQLIGAGFGFSSPAITGGMIAALNASSGIAGLVISRLDARRSMVAGAVALIIGPAITMGGLWSGSLALFLAGTVVAGLGCGAGFQGGLRLVLVTAPSDARAGLLSTVYLTSYMGFGLPSVAAGALIGSGVDLVLVATIYAAFIAVCAAVALVLQRVMQRSRRAELRADAVEQQELATA